MWVDRDYNSDLVADSGLFSSIRRQPELTPPRKTGTRLRSFPSCPGRPVHFRAGPEPPVPPAGRRTACWDAFLLRVGGPADGRKPVRWHSGACSLGLFIGVISTRGGARGDTADCGRSRDCSLARGSPCGSRPGEFSSARGRCRGDDASLPGRVAPSSLPPPLFSHHNEILRWRWLWRLAPTG